MINNMKTKILIRKMTEMARGLAVFCLLAVATCQTAKAADDNLAVQNLQRAINMMDATMQKSFRGTNTNYYMVDVCDVANDDVSGPSDVWPYTAAIVPFWKPWRP